MDADAKYDVLLPRARGKIVRLRATYIGQREEKVRPFAAFESEDKIHAAENILGKIKARDISRQNHRATLLCPFYFVARGGGVPGGTKRRPGRKSVTLRSMYRRRRQRWRPIVWTTN